MATKSELKEELELKKKLGQKVESMAACIGQLKKDGSNDFSKYDYISNEQLTREMNEKLGEQKLSLSAEVVGFEERESTDNKQRQVIRTIVRMEFEITDLETGYSERKQFIGAEQDTGGKSFQQAVTQCSKYFYFKLFKVAASDEKDPDANTNTSSGKSSTKTNSSSGSDDDGRIWLNPNDADGRWEKVVKWLAAGNDPKGIYEKYKISKKNFSDIVKEAQELKAKVSK